jgi:hypothetical protein
MRVKDERAFPRSTARCLMQGPPQEDALWLKLLKKHL